MNIHQTRKKGLSLPVMLLCTKCNWTAKYYTSRKVKSNSKVNSCYGMNVGAAVAMKGIDRGCTA